MNVHSSNRIALSKRGTTKPPCECSTLVLLASKRAVDAASAGSLLSMALSAVVQYPFPDWFGQSPHVNNPFVSATLKATVRTSQGEWCEWDLTSATVGGTVM